MEPILARQEIDDLLKAIKDGLVDLESETTGLIPGVDFHPVNLFETVRPEQDELRVPNFDIILDSFCQNFSISLTNQLQHSFHVVRTGIDFMSFQEYMASQHNIGAIGVLNLAPLQQSSLVIMSSQLSFSMIELMLGASTEIDPLQLERKLTTIERNVLKSVLARAGKDLERAMSQLVAITSTLIKVESNARLVSITESDSEVVVGRFILNVGDLSGELTIIIPVATLEPLKEHLKDLLKVSEVRQNVWADQIKDAILHDMTANVIAQSGTIDLTVQQVLAMKAGDIINLNYDPNSPLKVLVEDNLKFFAIPGIHLGKKAISLTGVYEQGA